MLFCLTCTNRHHVFSKVVAPEILPAGGSTSGSRCEAKVSNGLLDEAMTEIKEILPLLVECLGEQDWSMMYYFSVIGDMGRLNPYHPWDWYILLSLTIKINHSCRVNIPYMDGMGNNF